MATNLTKTDVVTIGLGAAGGVAVLPLVQAGIEVVGLEAGTWLAAKDFAEHSGVMRHPVEQSAIARIEHSITVCP